MRRRSQREIDDMMDEHVRRMGEPEPYRSLRLQKERLEHERQQEFERAGYDQKAEQIRQEIKRMGHKPCA